MSDQIRINGNLLSWGSAYLKIDGEPFSGVKSINYGDSRSRTKGYGMGRHHAPRGRSAGKYEVDPLTITAEVATARAIRDLLVQRGGGTSFGNAAVTIVVQYIEGDTTITDVLEGCVLSKTSSKAEEGPDPLYVDLEFDVMRIKWNGKTLYDSTEGSP